MSVTLDGLGTVTSLATITVKTQIAGKITQVGFTEGQAVKAGDFLVQIDPQPYQAALDQAVGQLARDQATLGEAKLDLTRFTNLLKQDSIASQQVDTQRSLVQQTEAIVQSDKAAIDTAKINLAYCRIVSPIAGRIGLRLVDSGNYVQPSDANGLVMITQIQPISVIFSLAQDTIPQFLSKLRKGETMPVQAYDRTGTTLLATGRLSTVDNQIDTTTGTVRLRAEFPNENEELFPNQFVNVKLVVNTLHSATLVPAAGVQLGAPGTYAYVVNDANTVSVRPLKLGPSDAQHDVVFEGLSPGDKVVVDGADRLRDGAKVVLSTGTHARGNAEGGNAPREPGSGHRKHHDQPQGDDLKNGK
jgi:multidrug efflux system membrane fusion protein